MSASNWVDDSRRELSPDLNNRYRIDDVGLQLGLGVPLQMLGVSLVGQQDSNRTHSNGGRWDRRQHSANHNQRVRNKDEIQQTVDGIPIRKVYITNISVEVQRQEMYRIFGYYGQIMNIYLGVSKNDNLKQFAFITYANPKDAARVLFQRKFLDMRGRSMYATSADSWHQPKEGPDGKIIWKTDRTSLAKQQEESDNDDEEVTDVGEPIKAVEIPKEEGLNALNDDCLLHIFSFLSLKELTGVERVCKLWQALSFRIWRCHHELSFLVPPFSKMQKTTPMLEQYLRRCGESLDSLDLSVGNHTFNEATLAIIAKYCCNLKVLKVLNLYIGNRTLAHLGRSCPKLQSLVLKGCNNNDKELMSLLPKCEELHHLDLSHSICITGKCLANVKGPVSSLLLCDCPVLDTEYLIAGLEKMSNTLQSLTLSSCSKVRSDHVHRILSAVPNLTYLNLGSCFPSDFKSLTTIGHLTSLTVLNLNLNTSVDDGVLASIVDGCVNITNLNLSGCGGGCANVLTDKGLSVVGRLRKLTSLDISYLGASNNTSLKNISTRTPRLKQLICRGCPEIKDDGSAQVVTICNDLELFDLSGCNITQTTVSAAITSVKMRTNNVPLHLIVGGTNVLTDEMEEPVPLLTVDLSDRSEEHLRPDFIDDMFFPPSDSDDEEDLDNLSFIFDDMLDDFFIEGDTDSDSDTDDHDYFRDYYGKFLRCHLCM